MSTTNGNLKNLKVTDPQGNVYVLVPVDTEARQAIEEAKNINFDEDVFNVEETDTEVNLGLNGVPIGVDDTTPLTIVQDDQEGFVLGADTLFTSSLIGSTFTEFSSAATYNVDQKVVHDSKLYNCTTAVSVAGEWSDANWTEIPLIDLANQYTLSAIQDLATKEYVDSLVVSSISAAASIEYVSANYVNNTTFDAYSADVDSQLEALSAVTTWRVGSGAPSVTSGDQAGEMYLDVTNYDIYQCTMSGGSLTWGSSLCNIKGTPGQNGTNGTNGTDGIDGATWFSGTIVSGSQAHVDGARVDDYYLNTSMGNVYKCVSTDTWSFVCNIHGSDGIGITSVTNTWVSDSQGTTAPQSGWSSTPSTTPGEYLWSRFDILLSDNNHQYFYNVVYIPQVQAVVVDGPQPSYDANVLYLI